MLYILRHMRVTYITLKRKNYAILWKFNNVALLSLT